MTSGAPETRGHPLFAAFYEYVSVRQEKRGMAARRARLVGDLRGVVLEVGAGNGLNLAHYCQIDRLVIAEPDPHMLRRLRPRAAQAPFPTEIHPLDVDHLPFPDATFDAVVVCLVLCSVPDQTQALAAIRRVLKPGGELRFLEHVRAPGLGGRILDVVQPLWSCAGGGCHPNRRTEAAIRAAGFDLLWIERYQEGLLPYILGAGR